MSWLSQQEIDEENEKNKELYEAAFGTEELSEEQLAKRRDKLAIEKSIQRHNAKIDKTYKRYVNCLHDNGKLIYYYPLKGLTKKEIENALKNPPYI